VSQLYASHVAPGSLGLKGLVGIGEHLMPDTWLYVLALVGLATVFRRRGPAGVFLGAWLLLALGVVLWHRPFWFHHALLLWVPACGLAALLGGEIVVRFRERVPRRLGDAALAIGAAVLLVNDVAFFWVYEPSEAKRARLSEETDVETAVRRHAPCARLMVTSRHMYAFHLGIEVPPALAVTSAKRFQSDQLTAEEVRALVTRTRPEVVVLDSRWDQAIRDAVESTLPHDYALIYAGSKAYDVRAYVLRTLRCKT